MKKKWLIGLIIGTALICGSFYFIFTNQSEKENNSNRFTAGDSLSLEDMPPSVDEAAFCIYITGEIVNPGIYYLKEGSRIYDAVEIAGGFTNTADESGINLAESLEDEMHIVVPKIGEENTPGNVSGNAKVNINKAGLSDLTQIPGIGESKARAILAYREENGKFQSIEEIMNVSGIGEGLFGQIKDKIKV